MDDDEDNGASSDHEAEAEYSFEGYRIAFNRRVALTPPPAAAPSKG